MNYKIYEANLAGLQTRLATLNKRGARIGAAPITCVILGHEDVPVEGQPGMMERVVNIDVNGETPKFNGWSFVATLNHTVEGNVVRAIPGLEVPVQFRNRQPVCDHCQCSRNRRDTYIVRHDDGTFKQVGSNCLKDFLGHTDPSKLAAAAELILGAFDVCAAHTGRTGGNAMNIFRIDLPEYLNAVATVVLRDGRFITRKMANETDGAMIPTSVTAMGLFSSHRFHGNWAESAVKLATDAREWVISKYAPHLCDSGSDADFKSALMNFVTNRNDSLSDFEHNLLIVSSCEAIEPKMAGVAAYIIEAFRRAQPKAQAAQLNVAGLSVILGMFGKAKENLKFPAIRLMDESRHEYQLSLAGAASKNAGCIYVKGEKVGSFDDGGASRPYLGKITPQGRFFPASGCPSNVESELQKFAADPEGIATRYGRMTGCCCFCARKLTDARSTEVGYGPVCAHKFGLDWGTKATVAVETPAVAAEAVAA